MHKLNGGIPILQERRVLLTRPNAKNDFLALSLANKNVFSYCHPLLNVQIKNTPVIPCFYHADIIIAISENAVNFAHHQIEYWPSNIVYLAVGSATKKAFEKYNIEAINPDNQTSEGLLSLSCLTHVKHKNIIIIRGVGGREKLAQSLIEREANVSYFEVYTRQLVDIQHNDSISKWQQEKINTIVVTSGEMLTHIYANIDDKSLLWLQDLWLIVPSERVAILAKSFGAKNISMSNGADNASILKILLNE